MSYVPGGYYNSSDEYYSDDDLDGFSCGRSRNQVVTSLTTPKQDVENALYSAVMDNDLLGIQKALDNSHGVTIDSPIRSGWTALIHASSNLIVPVVKYLLHQGANVDQNDEGFTPLLAACSCTESSEQVLQVVEVLLEHKACVNISDNHRTTPLMMACKNGHEAVVNLILPMAVADAEDDVGWSALFWAVNSNQYKICTLLIERNYSLCLTDRNNQSLMDIASSKDLHDIITLLESYDDSDRHLEMLWRKVRTMIDNQTWKDVVPGKKFCGLDVPPYYPDVANMLFGMNCEHLTPLFMKENVNLSEFLCMTDEKLEKIGVFLPFQRRIILNGLEKFHKKRFRTITVAEPTNSTQFDVYNLLMLLSTHLKHLVVLNAGMRFANMKLSSLSVTPHDPDCEMAIHQSTLWNKFTPKDRNYCEVCEKFEALDKNIQEYGKKLQHVNQFLKQVSKKNVRPVDLITPGYFEEKRKTTGLHWKKNVLIYVCVPILFTFIYKKYS